MKHILVKSVWTFVAYKFQILIDFQSNKLTISENIN
jgi:hypothetical protein